jgi:ubiquinone/menaquinone biosynthesis C-methylase UbiE
MSARSTGLLRSMRDAYDAASAAWGAGPEIVYGALASELMAEAGVDLAGRRVLDLGAGTGAVSTVVAARGGVPIAIDASRGMARSTRTMGVPSVVGVAAGLPFGPGSFDLVVGAFVLNHLADPARAIREARRVLVPDGRFLASTFAAGPDHPVKAAVDEAAYDRGWRAPEWYERFKHDLAERVADPAVVAAMAREAGFAAVVAAARPVDLGPVPSAALVEYRLGMASLAEFAARLTPAEREDLVTDAVARMGSTVPPLRPAVAFVSAIAPSGPRRRG